MNTYEILTHLVCNLYDESTELVSIISAGNDEEAIRIAKGSGMVGKRTRVCAVCVC